MNPLDLYAKIEPLIGFDTSYEWLYEYYCHTLHPLNVKNILDIGCGNGIFLKKLEKEGFEAQGIERSAYMVHRALQQGVKASTQELDTFDPESFDAITAVADVMNYMQEEELTLFLEHIARALKKGGFFIGDINTLYGFEAVAEGVMVKETDDLFLSIDATFEKPVLRTKITLFTKCEAVYHKEEGVIQQYFHPLAYFKKLKLFTFQNAYAIKLFSTEKADKTIIVLQKVS